MWIVNNNQNTQHFRPNLRLWRQRASSYKAMIDLDPGKSGCDVSQVMYCGIDPVTRGERISESSADDPWRHVTRSLGIEPTPAVQIRRPHTVGPNYIRYKKCNNLNEIEDRRRWTCILLHTLTVFINQRQHCPKTSYKFEF